MSDPVDVSVIVPVFNEAAELLHRALAGVLRQTVRNFDVIVVDDGSDEPVDLARMGIDDPRLRVVRRRTNGGVGAARNTGVARATGTHVAFLDAGDEWFADKLESQLLYIAHAMAPARALATGFVLIDDVTRDGSSPVIQIPEPCRKGGYVPRPGDIIPISTLLIARAAFEDVGGFDETVRRSADRDFLLRLSRREGIDVVPVPKATIHVRAAPAVTRRRRARSVARDGVTTVMHVITGLGAGGAERVLTELVSADSGATVRHCVVSLTDRGVYGDRLEKSGIACVALGMKRGHPSLIALWRLTRLIRAVAPDVIQSWMYHADLHAAIALALSGRRAATSLYWGIRASDMDVSKYGVSLRLTVGACRLLSGLPDLVIANSWAGARYHMALGYHPRRLVVVANGVDTRKFAPSSEARERVRAALGIERAAFVAGMIARVDPMKDYATFCAVARACPDIVFVAVGAETDRLEDVPNIRGLGYRADIADILNAFDVLISTSAFGEGCSNALLEGLSTGLAIVATDVGDAARIIEGCGEMVTPGAVDGFVAALDRLRRDRRRCDDYGRQARRKALAHYDRVEMVKAFNRLYDGFGGGDGPISMAERRHPRRIPA